MNKIKVALISMVLIFSCGCYGYFPIEKLEINTGFGYDIIEKDGGIIYSDALEIIVCRGNRVFERKVIPGESDTIYNIVDLRNSRLAKKYFVGTERLYLISEKRAEFGIEDFIDFSSRDPSRNLNAFIGVCKQSPEEVFNVKFSEFDSGSQQIEGIIEKVYEDYFFTDKFTVTEFILQSVQKGRQIVLPYFEKNMDRIELTGIAQFKGEKMYKVIPLNEVELINLIKYNKGIGGKNRGYLSITTEDPLKYIDFDCSSESKVKAGMKGNQLKYDIDVTISADVKSYTLDNKRVLDDADTMRIGKMLEKKMEGELNDEVKRVQEDYGFDCLDITKYALASLGRNKGYESDDYFQNAIINVQVKVKIGSLGANSK